MMNLLKGHFALINWTKENSTSVVPIDCLGKKAMVGMACSHKQYPGCPAKIIALGKVVSKQ
jgi:hypothetical protein